ncbi:MAG: terminase TerL endonuclease subunit [Atopobiaceae bacterium]|jgi:phage terminase large subunit-like protein|nr:terminase large subunit [Atopobiaceae bacterium]
MRQQAESYCKAVMSGKVPAPRYVILQCVEFDRIWRGKDPEFVVAKHRLEKIGNVLKLLVMPKGLRQGECVYDCLSGFQWLFITATLCVVYRSDHKHRRYETALLEICRKNGKTFLIALIFVLLMLIEPRYGKFYSVAPDGALSREVKDAMNDLIKANPSVLSTDGPRKRFKLLRSEIRCLLTESSFFPLNYSQNRLDGKLPNAFLADEVGALPNDYAVEAMQSGQLTILNKLGCIISTKYPTINNPFEDHVSYAKKVLEGQVDDKTIFALLYEPSEEIARSWQTDDLVLMHGNPLACDMPQMMDDLKRKRSKAIVKEDERENFLCKHCNVVYQGVGTETYIPIDQVIKGRSSSIDFSGRDLYVGVDLAQTNDNTAVAIVAAGEDGEILADVKAFIPEGRIAEKDQYEHIKYERFVEDGCCVACGDMTIDYGVVEKFVEGIEGATGGTVIAVGYDRYNAMSSAQKWEEFGLRTVEIRQHSDTLHPPTKLLSEKAANGEFRYRRNKLLEINFENARCTKDTNLNKYVNKKRSVGKVDMVAALIDAVYLLQQDSFVGDFVVQSG